MELTVTYEGGETSTVSAAKIGVKPDLVTGWYDDDPEPNTFHPSRPTIRVSYREGDITLERDLPVTTVGFLRQDTSDNAGPDTITTGGNRVGILGSYADSVELTGHERLAKKAYFVDDEKADIDFSGLSLGAWYTDRTYWPLSFDDVDIRIVPQYPGVGPNENYTVAEGKAYRGFLYITIGKDDSAEADAANYTGVTKLIPLEEVYTVEKVEFASPPELDPFFFWQANSPDAWARRLGGKGAQLKVTYRGTTDTKTLPISALRTKEKIWNNPNPGEGADWNEEVDLTSNPFDFYVKPIVGPYTNAGVKANNGFMGITIYYRGDYSLQLPIDVHTKYVSLDIGPPDIELDTTRIGRDNDIDYGEPDNMAALGRMLTVTALYQAFNNPDSQKSIKLNYSATNVNNWNAAGEPYYSITDWPVDNTALEALNGKSRALTISHSVGGGTYDVPASIEGVAAVVNKRGKTPLITWITK